MRSYRDFTETRDIYLLTQLLFHENINAYFTGDLALNYYNTPRVIYISYTSPFIPLSRPCDQALSGVGARI